MNELSHVKSISIAGEVVRVEPAEYADLLHEIREALKSVCKQYHSDQPAQVKLAVIKSLVERTSKLVGQVLVLELQVKAVKDLVNMFSDNKQQQFDHIGKEQPVVAEYRSLNGFVKISEKAQKHFERIMRQVCLEAGVSLLDLKVGPVKQRGRLQQKMEEQKYSIEGGEFAVFDMNRATVLSVTPASFGKVYVLLTKYFEVLKLKNKFFVDLSNITEPPCLLLQMGMRCDELVGYLQAGQKWVVELQITTPGILKVKDEFSHALYELARSKELPEKCVVCGFISVSAFETDEIESLYVHETECVQSDNKNKCRETKEENDINNDGSEGVNKDLEKLKRSKEGVEHKEVKEDVAGQEVAFVGDNDREKVKEKRDMQEKFEKENFLDDPHFETKISKSEKGDDLVDQKRQRNNETISQNDESEIHKQAYFVERADDEEKMHPSLRYQPSLTMHVKGAPAGAALLDDGLLTFKVVLLGDTSVGKTCLAVRYAKNSFFPDSRPTIGVNFLEKRLNLGKKSLHLIIFDTAGQEKFRSLTSFYYRGSHGAVVVYDTTDKKTFEQAQYWVHQLRERGGSSTQLIIAGNKSDLEVQRAVSEEEAKKFAENVGARHLFCSAKTGAQVDELFLQLAKSMLQELTGVNLPTGKDVFLTNGKNENANSGCC